MKQIIAIFLVVCVTLAGMAALAFPVDAGAPAQVVYSTPTPLPDGRVIYKVQSLDTCISVALLHNISLDQLYTLNPSIRDECNLLIGQELLIALVTPEPTADLNATPTLILPTPTPLKGTARICVYLFDDINGNARAETDEIPLAGGAGSISDRSGQISLTGQTTADGKPVCFLEVPEGSYNVGVAPPQGYNPTTNMNYPLTLKAGDQSTLDFGAQVSAIAAPVEQGTSGRSPLLAILGGIILLGGIGLGFYARRFKR